MAKHVIINEVLHRRCDFLKVIVRLWKLWRSLKMVLVLRYGGRVGKTVRATRNSEK